MMGSDRSLVPRSCALWAGYVRSSEPYAKTAVAVCWTLAGGLHILSPCPSRLDVLVAYTVAAFTSVLLLLVVSQAQAILEWRASLLVVGGMRCSA